MYSGSGPRGILLHIILRRFSCLAIGWWEKKLLGRSLSCVRATCRAWSIHLLESWSGHRLWISCVTDAGFRNAPKFAQGSGQQRSLAFLAARHATGRMAFSAALLLSSKVGQAWLALRPRKALGRLATFYSVSRNPRSLSPLRPECFLPSRPLPLDR
jgi:hypothetical protein